MRLNPWTWVLALALPLGCGATVSLDDPVGSSGGEGLTGAGPFGPSNEAGHGDDAALDTGALDAGEPKLDVAPDVPLPPGACGPDCQVELTTAWTYDGPAGSPPLEPADQLLVIAQAGGLVAVAEARQGAITLARLDPSGQELWTLPLALPCDPCRLVELGLHPSGDLLLAGHGIDDTGSPVALAARVELGGPELVWLTSTPLMSGSGIVARAGSVVVHDDGLLLQPTLEANGDGLERLGLLTYDEAGGALVSGDSLAAGFASGDAPPPRAAVDTRGTVVVGHPAWTGAELLLGTVRWLDGIGPDVLAMASRAEPPLQLAAAPDGRVLSLAQAGATGGVLALESGSLDDPEQWSLLYALEASGQPTLAVDGNGHAHVLARVPRGLQVLRFTEEAELIWKLVLPLALDAVSAPVSLALTPSGELVVGGFVGGARHVELLWHSCGCG